MKTLASDPSVNVNWDDLAFYRTPFYRACYFGHLSIVEFLLNHPRVDVSQPHKEGGTPFYAACHQGHKEVVALLLADRRIDVNKPENDQRTPLWMASQEGQLLVVQLILASGKDVDTKTKSIGTAPWSNKTAAANARRQAISTHVIWETKKDTTERSTMAP